ncbi:MAG: toll/interleukin-1 receptor domain-containing protein [Bacteroidaceae bacterium]|nr:toll/interleukin-1 receptor domain-containing protein [Bacteroidaceae bacterium]
MKYDVFISYSRRDYVDENRQVIPGNVISKIKELFQANQITYWIDEEGISSGDAFATVIAQNIRSSKIFLFISSENSNQSEWTSNEIAAARSFGKNIIPFKTDDSPYNDSVIMYIARLDYIEYKNNHEMALSRLLASVRKTLDNEANRKEQEKREEERRRREETERNERKQQLETVGRQCVAEEKRLSEIEDKIRECNLSLENLKDSKKKCQSRITDLKKQEMELKRMLGMIADKVQEPAFSSSDIDAKQKVESSFRMNWMVKGVYMVAALIALVLACYFVYNSTKYPYTSAITAHIAFSICTLISILGVVRILKNYRDGFVWMMISIGCLNLLEWVTLIWSKALGMAHYTQMFNIDRLKIIVCSVVVCIVLALPLFVGWGGKANLWSQMQVSAVPFKNDKLRLVFVALTALMVLAAAYNRLWFLFR